VVPRDYKQRPARAPARKKSRPVSAWTWFGSGVCVGALCTVAIMFYEPSFSVPGITGNQNNPEEKAPAKTRFEFYTMLPEKEIAVTETDLDEITNKAPVSAQSTLTAGTRYLLQVGSFRNMVDADRLKAQLAFLGLEAAIQTVSINGAETWHRVRVGPYAQIQKLNAARAQLKKNSHDSMVLKLKN